MMMRRIQINKINRFNNSNYACRHRVYQINSNNSCCNPSKCDEASQQKTTTH